mgnify:CR=1 FL=1
MTTTRTTTMTRVSQLWDLIETWGFREDIKDAKGISLMMMTMMMMMRTRWRTTTRTMTTMAMVSQLWDWIEIWCFCEYLHVEPP